MRLADLVRLTSGSIRAHRLRASLTALGVGIGVAAVVLLTSIGEGVRRFVLSEFTQFGTNIISVTPGRTQTLGGSIGAFGNVRPLTVDDAQALARAPHVLSTNAMMQGNAEVEALGRKRRTTILGVGPSFAEAFRFEVAQGRFLPEDDPRAPRNLAVLGAKMNEELFRGEHPLGRNVRVGGQRYRVVGVMQPKGTTLGFDLDDTVFVPTARALELFDRQSVFEIQVSHAEDASVQEVVEGVRRILIARHGDEDFTITTQQQMLDTLGSVLSVLTFAVGALGSISLLVGGVGIFTIMTIGVRERTTEIGLLRALGAARSQVLRVFLSEAVLLAAIGGGGGLVVGLAVAASLDLAVPALPVSYSLPFIVMSEALAVAVGLVSGVLPAMRAARLEPVEALRAE
ncbi:MAG: ABC transporter permease [Steroidobacteraceae bacterium]|jgi:putative ABC transport system permease protein|nr:ABC transporter permease [Steroidobacteraceae bacterium]